MLKHLVALSQPQTLKGDLVEKAPASLKVCAGRSPKFKIFLSAEFPPARHLAFLRPLQALVHYRRIIEAPPPRLEGAAELGNGLGP